MNKYQEALKIVEIGEGDVKAMVNLPYEVTEQAFKTIKELVDRATAKAPKIKQTSVGTLSCCPNCDAIVFMEYEIEKENFCAICGQALDWSENERNGK